jgi:RNA polymerase-interacting CarD/CdnL/TRCF family regulator
MQFKTGEMVVHPRYGIGSIVRLAPRQFGSNLTREYYEIAIPTGTIWVPTGSPELGLRKVTPSADLPRYRKVLKSTAVALAADSKQRKLELAERSRMGSLESRCELLRDLCAQRLMKPLDENANSLLRKVRESLCAEWAASQGSTSEEASREVDALLAQGQAPRSSSVA